MGGGEPYKRLSNIWTLRSYDLTNIFASFQNITLKLETFYTNLNFNVLQFHWHRWIFGRWSISKVKKIVELSMKGHQKLKSPMVAIQVASYRKFLAVTRLCLASICARALDKKLRLETGFGNFQLLLNVGASLPCMV